MTKDWNIWDVKNRWLRAALAWVLMIITVVGVICILLVVVIWSAIKGVIEGVGDALHDFFKDIEWPRAGKLAWAALTARGRP